MKRIQEEELANEREKRVKTVDDIANDGAITTTTATTTGDQTGHSTYLHDRVQEMITHGRALSDRYDPDHPHARSIYQHALAQAMKVDPYIVAQVGNLDFLRRPDHVSCDHNECGIEQINCAQALTLGNDTRSIDAIISFLSDTENLECEPYEHNKEMQETIRKTLKNIGETYDRAGSYLRSVACAMWRDENFLTDGLCEVGIGFLHDAIVKARNGEPCVFDHFDEHGRAVYV